VIFALELLDKVFYHVYQVIYCDKFLCQYSTAVPEDLSANSPGWGAGEAGRWTVVWQAIDFNSPAGTFL
jgi:hypothetical protein